MIAGACGDAPSDTAAAGVVIEQDPTPETEAPEGTAVDIVVSTGPQQATAAQGVSTPGPAQQASAMPVVSTPTPQQQAPSTQTIPTPAALVPAARPKDDEKAEKKQDQREDKVEKRQEQQEERAENKREKREEKAENKREK